MAHRIGARDVIALSTNAYIDPTSLLGKTGELKISLADGTRTTFGGDISKAEMLGSGAYREQIAQALFDGIHAYASANDAPQRKGT